MNTIDGEDETKDEWNKTDSSIYLSKKNRKSYTDRMFGLRRLNSFNTELENQ